MTGRIKKLAELAVNGKLYPQAAPVEYSREDLLLSDAARNASRICKYMANQKPIINEYCRMTGSFRFDGTCVGDIFTRHGYRHIKELLGEFYNKPYKNLVSLEWQHSAARFDLAVEYGLDGFVSRIEKAKALHADPERLGYLEALSAVCGAIAAWADKCAACAAGEAKNAATEERRGELTKLAGALPKAVRKGAGGFYEAVLVLYFFYSFLPDSIGLIDRYLYPYYKKDMDSGALTPDGAKELLQELFAMIQAKTSPDDLAFKRGGQCHFAVGGYTAGGEDGFNELSYLVVEALLDVPLYCPQVSLRWTQKTPPEAFRYMLDCERKDKYRRIAFMNDEPRIKGFTQIMGMGYEKAVSYTSTGCAEPIVTGGIYLGNLANNIAPALTGALYGRSGEAEACRTFEEFYLLFEDELTCALKEMMGISDKFNAVKAKDTDVLSSIFLDGCIESAKSATQGGCSSSMDGMSFVGITNVADSLSVIKQFVYDEKRFTMAELVAILKGDWAGHESDRDEILKTARFYGNGDPLPDGMARRLHNSISQYLKDKKDHFGFSFANVGNQIGYNPHHTIFGGLTEATPDGRHSGDMLAFGLGQTGGKDREGPTALFLSAASADETGILCGANVFNVTLDEKLVTEEAQFEKTAALLETLFQLGAGQFQLNYVSREDLLRAKADPSAYSNLRVRVSGFSEYFVNLLEPLQDEIIRRTVKTG